MRFFFYGTLMDADVLAAVVGRRIESARFQDAILDGFRRVYRRGASYPILLDDPGGQIDGVVSDLTAADTARLDAFEGKEYRRAARTVTLPGEATVDVQVYLTNPGVPASSQPWDFENWQRRHRAAYLRRVRRSGSPQS